MFGDRRPNHVLINEYIPGQGIMVRKAGVKPAHWCTCAVLNMCMRSFAAHITPELQS